MALAAGVSATENLWMSEWPRSRLYPGVTAEQSAAAYAALSRFHNGDFKGSEFALRDLDSLERKGGLPPLSQLLLASIAAIRLQRDDAEDPEEMHYLRGLIQSAGETGADRCREPERGRHPLCRLIQGGIQGFAATLEIPDHPSLALTEGLQALHSLERGLSENEDLTDAYLGLGIFQCTGANAPLAVRAALKVFGRSVSMGAGIAALRRASYRGQYTTVAGQLCLIQFLSPYDSASRREKDRIFQSLEQNFPLSAYYSFLRWDEALCFYPDSFYRPDTRPAIEQRILAVSTHGFAGWRALNLVKYQYTLINSRPEARFAPDSSLDMREYAYYPVFVQALHARKDLIDTTLDSTARSEKRRRLATFGDSALSLLEEGGMNPANRRLFAWHIRDALRPALPNALPKTVRKDSGSAFQDISR